MTVPLIRRHYRDDETIERSPSPDHEVLSRVHDGRRQPQAVKMFVESRDYGKVDLVKQQIINLYSNDMAEQTDERSEYVSNFFFRIPSELSKHDKRYIISHIQSNARIREYQGPIRWLDEAMIINIANCVDEPSAALNLSMSDPSFKCYLMDTGLLISLAFKDRPILENELYKQILLSPSGE